MDCDAGLGFMAWSRVAVCDLGSVARTWPECASALEPRGSWRVAVIPDARLALGFNKLAVDIYLRQPWVVVLCDGFSDGNHLVAKGATGMTFKQKLRWLIDCLTGKETELPSSGMLSYRSLLWPIWWVILFAIICVFSGQSSKFIYIDF